MKDNDLRADTDDQDDFDTYRAGPRQKPRGPNWLAHQVALGIVMGGCVLWVLQAIANFIQAKMILHQMQVILPSLGHL